MIIIVATFGQALSGSGHAVNIIGVIIVWRFLVSLFFYFLRSPSLLFFYRWASG
jgi:hypothetical protein